MAYTKPTLTELIDAVKSDLFSRFPSLDPQIANSFAANIAEVIAGGVNQLYGYLDFISEQLPDTAVDEFIERWATIFGLSRLAATKAGGDVVFTGVIGSSVATGEELVSSSGVIYTVDTGFTLAAGSETHAVTASTTGTAGNLGASGTLTFVSVPSGMDTTATVDTGGLTGGTARETDAELQARLLATLSSPPKGGSVSDYEIWATEATDVTRSWVRNITTGATFGDTIPAGEVWQYFVMDNTYTQSNDGSELVTNGGFDADTDWTRGTGWTIAAGVATKAAGTASTISQSISADIGSAYLVTFTISGYSAGSITPYVGSTAAGTARSANGTYYEVITNATDGTFSLNANATFAGNIDNVSVYYYGDGNIGRAVAGDVSDIEDYIDPIAPVTAVYSAKIPDAYPVSFNLTIAPDTPTTQLATENELRSTILNERIVGGTMSASDFYEAMSRVAGLTSWTINSINGSAPTSIVASAGSIHTLGLIEFV